MIQPISLSKTEKFKALDNWKMISTANLSLGLQVIATDCSYSLGNHLLKNFFSWCALRFDLFWNVDYMDCYEKNDLEATAYKHGYSLPETIPWMLQMTHWSKDCEGQSNLDLGEVVL